MKPIRVLLSYVFFWFLCMGVVVSFMSSVPDIAQMVFAFGCPAVLVWHLENRRSIKQAFKSVQSRQSGDTVRHGKTFLPYDKVAEKQMVERYETFKKHAQAKIELAAKDETQQSALAAKAITKRTVGRSILSRPKKAKKVAKPKGTNRQGWVPKGETANISGRDIGDLVYVGAPLRLNTRGYNETCRAYIDPALSIARKGGDLAGDGMPYWPGYSTISAVCRATYLDWLAAGRRDADYNAGYMFLYFYGLERRYFVDAPNGAEQQDIVAEVQRLMHLYPNNRSVQRYLGDFVQAAQTVNTNIQDLRPSFEQTGWDLPISLNLAIGARIDRGEYLSADWVLSWYIHHPDCHLRTAALRCADEFATLFRLLFEARFPEGLKVTKPRKKLTAHYVAASTEFEIEIDCLVEGTPVPDITGLRKPIEIAQEIVDEATEALNKFSRYLGRNPHGRGSLEAQALLPAQLWPHFPSDALNALKVWAGDKVRNGGVITVDDLIERLEGTRASTLSKRRLTDAADALGRLGFGCAPDPRFALRAPVLGEPVVLFDLEQPIAKLEDVSEAYRSALVELALGAFVIQSDGEVVEAERHSLKDRATQVEGLSDAEHRRLHANLDWMLMVPPDMKVLRRRLKGTGPEQQGAFRTALVSAAHADGVIQPQEVAGIERIYKILGLDPALVYSDLHAGDTRDGPVRVRAAKAGSPGQAIPPETDRAQALDPKRIAAIVSDTERVSDVLGDIFREDTPEDSAIQAQTSDIEGLDQKHAQLVRSIIAQDHWNQMDFEALCKPLDLMPAGALEALNEWAFDTYDTALLDEYEGYAVDEDIATAVKQNFEKESLDGEVETA